MVRAWIRAIPFFKSVSPGFLSFGDHDHGNNAVEPLAFDGIWNSKSERQSAGMGIRQDSGETQVIVRPMRAEDVARAVVYMASLPLDSNVATITVMATKMPFVGRG